MKSRFQKRPKPHQWKRVGLAVVKIRDNVNAECSCGWNYSHPRPKILDNAIDRHFAKRHDSRGIRV